MAYLLQGGGNYLNEIIWKRTSSHNARRSFGPVHDVILFYTKSSSYTFNIVRRPYMNGHVESRYSKDETGQLKFISGGNILTGSGSTGGDSGKTWRGFNPTAKNRHWAVPGFLTEDLDEDFHNLPLLEKLEELYKLGRIEIKEGTEYPTPVRYLKPNDGQPVQDIWAYQPYTEGTVFGTDKGIDEDVMWLGTTSPERLGYPTQKPEGLLKRIISASSNEGDTILDAYCGCGTSIISAQELNRQWIGIDITFHSISLILRRLRKIFNEEFGVGNPKTVDLLNSIELHGVPRDMEAVDALIHKKDDRVRKEFEKWAVLTYSDNRAVINEKKGADKGIDGIAYIRTSRDEVKPVILSVKSGHIGRKEMGELRGTIERENAAAGIMITRQEPTKPMIQEAKEAGKFKETYLPPFDRLQIVTVQEILDGARMNLPLMEEVTKKAQKAKADNQAGLFSE